MKKKLSWVWFQVIVLLSLVIPVVKSQASTEVSMKRLIAATDSKTPFALYSARDLQQLQSPTQVADYDGHYSHSSHSSHESHSSHTSHTSHYSGY